MAEVINDTKYEKEAKVRCAQFLLEMFKKYGAEIQENMAVDDGQTVEDKED